MTILGLGGLLSGLTFATAFFVANPETRNVRAGLLEFSIGVGLGLLGFSPVAFAEKFRDRIRAVLERYGSWALPYMYYVYAVALGYMISSTRHHTMDTFAFISEGVVFFGALLGVLIGVATTPTNAEHAHESSQAR